MKTVLFDLDGTLCDSEVGIGESLIFAMRQMGYSVPSASQIRGIIGPPFAVGLPRIGVLPEDIEKVIAGYRDHYQRKGALRSTAYSGITDLLQSLTEQGLTLGVATSKPEASAFPILDHLGMSPFFRVRAGATLDDRRSRKADVIAHALDQLRNQGQSVEKDDVLMVGDREHDVIGAQSHGLSCVGVLWGYGSEAEFLAAGATTVFPTTTELGQWISLWAG
jgi:phosphoglycolate phosphatase